MRIIKASVANIDDIAQVLREGGLVIMPTETIYGAMTDATNPAAVEKLTHFKNRPFGKPYSIAVTSLEMAKKYADVNPTAEKIYQKFLPGPVTVISKTQSTNSQARLAPGVASEKNTVGIRIPDYKLVVDVANKLGRPITATSANASYKKRPYKIDDILENISSQQKKLIDLIIDAGELPHREPSTVIDTALDDIATLRQGEIKFNNGNEILSRSEEETRNFGKEMWQKHEQFSGQRAIVFALTGEMGAGKTQFTKGLAKAMGVEEEVVSPTFSLENRYEAPIAKHQNPDNNQFLNSKITLSHIDSWRMENDEELKVLGFDSLITDRSVIAIEWADRVSDFIRKYNEEAIIIWINISYGRNDNERIIKWTTI